MKFKFYCFILFIALCGLFSSCKKSDVTREKKQSLKSEAVVNNYTVHATVRKLDAVGGDKYNYEFTFWVTTNDNPDNVLKLPGNLRITGELRGGPGKLQCEVVLPAGSRVTRRIYELKSPLSVVGKFSVPGSYQGKPIKCDATVVEQPYNLSPIKVQGTGFVDANGSKFIPWGVNYTNTHQIPLMDDEWFDDAKWEIIKNDFREMKAMNLNVIRIHLQYHNFMNGVNNPNLQALKRLRELIEFTAQIGLYVDITGLSSYFNEDPAWYTNLNETGRWATQAIFWKAVARASNGYNNVFCYNLMNEPVTPSKSTDIWLPGESLAGYYFIQHLTREPKGRSWLTVTRAWITQLKKAIREEDSRTPVTVGFIGLGNISNFNDLLDYNSIHIYPEEGKIPESLKIIKASVSNKPLIVEETSWGGGFKDMTTFINTTQQEGYTAGYMAHYHGETIEELEKKPDIGSAIQREWYKLYTQELNPNYNKP
ncbi:hypothetical protein DJ568_00970 [Mucilaginibacter hurinus]|uniref:Uncharacterized protein n=1 Tax=Mucilaginibacter hurinus TaxID=2201324 RepID=A0A367GUJ4_9SPHI|nr:cellulase family glycosylhydrolase [Mucilaginibacter hurinus]RCH56461.1 hypothetical protein DJ568_00970 [Mucilaginibacter hurinus]